MLDWYFANQFLIEALEPTLIRNFNSGFHFKICIFQHSLEFVLFFAICFFFSIYLILCKFSKNCFFNKINKNQHVTSVDAWNDKLTISISTVCISCECIECRKIDCSEWSRWIWSLTVNCHEPVRCVSLFLCIHDVNTILLKCTLHRCKLTVFRSLVE